MVNLLFHHQGAVQSTQRGLVSTAIGSSPGSPWEEPETLPVPEGPQAAVRLGDRRRPESARLLPADQWSDGLTSNSSSALTEKTQADLQQQVGLLWTLVHQEDLACWSGLTWRPSEDPGPQRGSGH
ncbi:hypothetical protein EYF80_019279 [Liparis tanakae]|uniref:Uncharacterized protein n=1 Tax=Liparis tanakae TaxID=230148 RepID=A0A4Z2HZU9_9TELE|nr:hypothetical protein EYF80_019279 [Liparis tanakae]